MAASQARNVTARFAPQTNNTVFVSSEVVPANLGGLDPYDAKCNELATAAGLNNAEGNAYKAWMSTSSASARDRIGSARGFARVDGRPFMDYLTTGPVLNPLLAAIHRRRPAHS